MGRDATRSDSLRVLSLTVAAEQSAAIVLAAGQGTRMKSDLPKVLHPCCERPMVGWVLNALKEADVSKTIVVVGHGGQSVKDAIGDDVIFVEQSERLGTAHAAMMAAPALEGFQGQVLVLAGDTPLLTGNTLSRLLSHHRSSEAKCAMTVCRVDDPTGYGRIVRNAQGHIVAIVEHKDCTPEQLAIREINPAVYCFDSATLLELLPQVKNDNAQGEYYLPDLIKLIVAQGGKIEAVESDDPDEFKGVNDRWQLAEATQILKMRILRHHAESGVTIVDPASTSVGPDVEIGRDATLMSNTIVTGNSVIGKNCVLGPNSYVRDSILGDDVTVFMSHVNQAKIENGSTVGPFSNVRPGSLLGQGVKVGNFVEVKKTTLGDRVSVSHLSYLGDASVGEGTNIGAGTITCNYDGFNKHSTTIGAECFIGSNSTLVAPLSISDDSFVAAGSVVTHDVPSGAMAIGRSHQTNKEGWFTRWRKLKTDK